MAFYEGRLPTCIRYGYRGGATFQTSIVTVNSGAEQRNGLWANGRGKWDIEYIKDFEGMKELQKFFHARQGMLQGFRFKDWLDYEDDGIGYLVDTANIGVMQLVKRYTSSDYLIRKPENITIKKDGVVVTPTVDTTTGLVTFTTTTQSISSATAGTTTTVVTSAAHGLVTGQKVLFQSGTGSWAAWNGKLLAVTVLTATSFAVAFNSTGFTGVGYGQIRKGATTTDGSIYTWTGTFDKPVRFDTDSFSASITDKGIYTVDNLPIIEIKDYQ